MEPKYKRTLEKKKIIKLVLSLAQTDLEVWGGRKRKAKKIIYFNLQLRITHTSQLSLGILSHQPSYFFISLNKSVATPENKAPIQRYKPIYCFELCWGFK